MKRLTLISFALVFTFFISCEAPLTPNGQDEIYTIVDQSASLPGGIESLYSYVSKNMKYPNQAKNTGVEGRVFVEFVVNSSGEMESIKVIKGIGAGCDAESLRVLTEYQGTWTPAKHEGKIVNQKIILPISFQLGNDKENPELGKQNEDGTYNVVDQAAKLPGGMESLYAYVGENMKYPKQARKLGVEGKVYIEFIVNESGTVVSAKVIQGIGAGCDNEALRAFKSYSKAWIPAKHDGKVVKQKMVLPVTFMLGKNKEGKS